MSRGERGVDRQPVSAEGDLEIAVGTLELCFDQVDRRRADEPRDELVDRAVVERLRCVHLLEMAVPHDRDAVAERHRLDLVVGHVQGRHADAALQRVDLGAHLHAQLRVQVRERLVHQEGLRLAHDRASHRHPLALAARERARLALEVLLDLQGLRRVPHPLLDLVLRQLAQLQPEGQVLLDGHVRVERVVLEDHRDVAILGSEVVDDPLPDPDLAAADLLEPGQHAQRRGLAAARGPNHDHQLAVLDREVQVIDGLGPVVVDLRDRIELDLRHGASFSRLRLRAGEDAGRGGWRAPLRPAEPTAAPRSC